MSLNILSLKGLAVFAKPNSYGATFNVRWKKRQGKSCLIFSASLRIWRSGLEKSPSVLHQLETINRTEPSSIMTVWFRWQHVKSHWSPGKPSGSLTGLRWCSDVTKIQVYLVLANFLWHAPKNYVKSFWNLTVIILGRMFFIHS